MQLLRPFFYVFMGSFFIFFENTLGFALKSYLHDIKLKKKNRNFCIKNQLKIKNMLPMEFQNSMSPLATTVVSR